MNVKYRGKQIKDSDGYKLEQPFEPFAIVSFRINEMSLAIARIEETGYKYDAFGDDTDGCAYIAVDDKQGYNDFMKAWKEAKKKIQSKSETDRTR